MNELLIAYFDRPLNREETANLCALLENDPDSAKAFARLARADLAMEQHFANELMSKTLNSIASTIRRPASEVRPMPFRWPSANEVAKWGAVAAVLIFSAYVISQLAGEPEQLVVEQVKEDDSWRMLEPPAVPGAHSIRMIDGLSREEQKAAALLRARLAQFFLPDVQIRNKTINAAVAELEALMQKLDHRGSLEANPVFLAGDQQSDSERKVRLVRGNLSVLDALELLAIQAGKQLAFSADGVEMVEFSESAGAPILTKTFDLSSASGFSGVSPYIAPATITKSMSEEDETINLELSPEVVDFEGFVNYGSPITTEDGNVIGSSIIDPIFSTRGVDADPALQLDIWGVSLSGNASARWAETEEGEPKVDQMIVTAGLETMNRVGTLMNAITGSLSNETLVRIDTKIFEVPETLAVEDTLLNAEGLEALIAGIQGDRESTSVAYPSLLTRNAQQASIQSTIDHAVELTGGETVIDQTGTAINVNPVLEGEVVRLGGSVDLGFIPEDDLSALENAATKSLRMYEESPIMHHKVEFDAYVGPAEAAVFSMAGTKPGTSIIYVIAAKRQ